MGSGFGSEKSSDVVIAFEQKPYAALQVDALRRQHGLRALESDNVHAL